MSTGEHQCLVFGGHTMGVVGLSKRMPWWALMLTRFVFCIIMMIVAMGGYVLEQAPDFAAPGPSVLSASFFLLAACSALA
eukprot:IDg23459t1